MKNQLEYLRGKESDLFFNLNKIEKENKSLNEKN